MCLLYKEVVRRRTQLHLQLSCAIMLQDRVKAKAFNLEPAPQIAGGFVRIG